MLVCVAKPTRQPSGSSPARAVTMNIGYSSPADERVERLRGVHARFVPVAEHRNPRPRALLAGMTAKTHVEGTA